MLVMESAGLFTTGRPNPFTRVVYRRLFSERKPWCCCHLSAHNNCFSNIIHYSGKYGRWTPAEKAAFLTGLKRFGRGKWKEIAKLIPTRSTGEFCLHNMENRFFVIFLSIDLWCDSSNLCETTVFISASKNTRPNDHATCQRRRRRLCGFTSL